MCGIAGTYGRTDETIPQLLDTMTHRGPDGRDVIDLTDSTFGHVRLAIVDVQDGQQPMSSPDKQRWLICNGEVYNHDALRELCTDYDFQTQSDNEVILALYDRYGVKAAEYLDGMYGFALWDGEGVYLARDPLGIKPLYYGWQDGVFYFASEIKTLKDVVDEIKIFPPGHWYHSKHGFHKFYDVAEAIDRATHRRPSTFQDIRESLQRAVRKRLMSDVPLGVFLSGGLDSSIISTLVAQDIPGVHSFFVGIENGEDRRYSQLMADFLGTQHHETIYTEQEVLDALPDIIYHLESFDPPLLRSAIPNYFLARLARQYVTVVLTGEGADELFSGYHYLKQLESPEAWQRELVAITASLHNSNLLRCDRMSMAHSLEGRVPFLDREFIEVAAAVPLVEKTHDGVEKWALRKAFEGMLPDEVIWRRKMQFSEGAGSADILKRIAESEISDDEFEAEHARIVLDHGHHMRSKEELYCYRIFCDLFPPQTANLVTTWASEHYTI